MSRSHLVSTLIALVFLLGGGFADVAAAQEPDDAAPTALAPASPPAAQPASPAVETAYTGRVLDAEDLCPVALPDWATPPEHYAWSRICLGKDADMSRYKDKTGATAAPGEALPQDDGFGCEARYEVQDWPADRVLRGRFIRLLTTREPYIQRAARPSVFIQCAVIEGDIDLALETVPVMLRLEKSRILGDIYMSDTIFAKDVSLDGSDLKGWNLFAEGMQVGDDLFFRKGRVGQFVLVGARVAGDLELSSSIVGLLDVPGTPVLAAGLHARQLSVGGNLLATEKTYLQEVDLLNAAVGKSVNFDTAWVRDLLNLNGIEIGEALFLREGMRTSEIDLVAARVGTGIEANDIQLLLPSAEVRASGRPVDRLTGTIQAGRMQVDGSIFFNRARIAGNLLLGNATVRGPIDLSGSNISGTFAAIDAQVAGRVSPVWGARLNDVDLRGATIDGGLQLFGGRFDGFMDLRNATLGGLELWADQRSEAAAAAPTAPQAVPVDETARGADAAIQAESGADKTGAPADDGTPEASLVPKDAKIEEKVVPGKTQEPDPVDSVDAVAAGRGTIEWNVTWGPQAALDLQNADIGVLQAKFMQSWQLDGVKGPSGEPAPLPVRLENLRYDRLVVAPTVAGSVSSELDARPLIKWVNRALDATLRLGAQPAAASEATREANATGTNGAAGQAAVVQPSFVPQPFRQLEETLRNMGAAAQADEVLVAGHNAAMASLPAGPEGWPQTLSYGVWWALVGFGAHPFRVLWWFAALVAVGVFVARLHGPLCRRGWTDCFWYSLENALPIVQPSRDHQKVVHDDPALRNFFHFQKVAGFVLATILVGALTLLGG